MKKNLKLPVLLTLATLAFLIPQKIQSMENDFAYYDVKPSKRMLQLRNVYKNLSTDNITYGEVLKITTKINAMASDYDIMEDDSDDERANAIWEVKDHSAELIHPLIPAACKGNLDLPFTRNGLVQFQLDLIEEAISREK